MNLMLTWMITRLAQAKTVEEVFGELEGNRVQQADVLKAAYHQMARLSHPDVYPIPEEKSCAHICLDTQLASFYIQPASKQAHIN